MLTCPLTCGPFQLQPFKFYHTAAAPQREGSASADWMAGLWLLKAASKTCWSKHIQKFCIQWLCSVNETKSQLLHSPRCTKFLILEMQRDHIPTFCPDTEARRSQGRQQDPGAKRYLGSGCINTVSIKSVLFAYASVPRVSENLTVLGTIQVQNKLTQI